MGGTDGILTKFTRHFIFNSLPITTPTKSNLTITLIWGGIGGVHYIPNTRNNNSFIPKISIIRV
jgi:hypothetical protein